MPPSMHTLFIIAAPSGAGKSSLVNALLKREPTLALSVSHTTRPPRPGERYARHYHFVERAEFEKGVSQGTFLEYAEVHGNLYGTSRAMVRAKLGQERDVVLEIDWQGARQIRARQFDCVSVFILPPSWDELNRRLRLRCTDTAAVIDQRLRNAREEIAHANEFDYIIVNDKFELALTELQTIVRAARLRSILQIPRQQALIS